MSDSASIRHSTVSLTPFPCSFLRGCENRKVHDRMSTMSTRWTRVQLPASPPFDSYSLREDSLMVNHSNLAKVFFDINCEANDSEPFDAQDKLRRSGVELPRSL